MTILGSITRVAYDLHLYFYTLRDIIKWALEQRLGELLQQSA